MESVYFILSKANIESLLPKRRVDLSKIFEKHKNSGSYQHFFTLFSCFVGDLSHQEETSTSQV